nr:TonB-dependent receptor [Fulvivirga marina]
MPGLTEPDVLQTLQALPGIHSINETVSDINVRGGTNDQNLVLWNGIRIYQPGHFFGLISVFNPYLVKEANLIKNGTSAALGESVSSTIDIHTDNDVAEEFTGGVGVNLINADAFVKVPLSDKTSIEVGGRRSIADVVKTSTYRQYFERTFSNTEVINASNDKVFGSNEAFYFYDASLKVTSEITKKDKLRFNFLGINNKITYEESAIMDGQTEFKTSSLRQRSMASNVVYERLWSKKVKTSAQAYLSSYGLKAINFDVLNAQRLIQENEILDIGFKLDSRVSLSKNMDILTGYQLSEIGVGNLEDINKPIFRRYIKEVVQTHSLFAEATFSSNSGNTNLRSGLRTNYFKKFDKVRLEPRLAFSQKILPYLSVEVLGELKSQVTTQIIDLQTDFLGVEKRRWILVNDNDVPLIRSKQISLGLQYNRPRFLVSVDGYYKKVDGIISSSQGFQNQYQFVRSIGTYDAIGFDFIMNKKFKRLSMWLSYSYARNTFSFKNFSPPEFPNNLDIRHSTTLGSTYQTRRFQFSVGANAHTGKPFTKPQVPEQIKDNQVIYDSPNSYRLDDYVRIDCSARYNFKVGKEIEAQAGGGVWNILDRKNIVNTYFQVGDSGSIREVDQKSLGITPNVFVRISF